MNVTTIQTRENEDSINSVKLSGTLKENLPTSLIIKSANLRLLDPIGQGWYPCYESRFVVLILSSGEFGVVYKGYITHQYTDELVAVKTLKGNYDCGNYKIW